MALRFVRTIDKAPHMFASRHEADLDWLLYCGGWQVGRIMPAGGGRGLFAWSLTGPHTPEAPVTKQGEIATLPAAKEQLVAAMRAWAIWAGVRRRDGGAPIEPPRWVLRNSLGPNDPIGSYGPEADWLRLSGQFVAGRVRQLLNGPLQDHAHWMLLGMSETTTPGRRSGRAKSIDLAKADLHNAWHWWLDWAELATVGPR